MLSRPRPVGLPAPVTGRLGLTRAFTDADAFSSAVDWFESRPERYLCRDPADEVIYEAFLGPFLGFRGELGTLLSLTCFLPFLIENLAATSVILLPLLKRGRVRRKGTAGSPFAVANHSRLHPGTSGFDGIEQEEVWHALVAATRRVGVRMGMVLPLATVAMDSAHILSNPSTVYWWRAEPDELLTGEPLEGEWPAFVTRARPVSTALDLFTEPPSPGDVALLAVGEDRFWVSRDGNGGAIAVANAYPDPVVGDQATYAWRDVAAIRFTTGIVPGRYAANSDEGEPLQTPHASEAFLLEALQERRAAGETVLLADVSASLPARLLEQALEPYPETLLMAEQLWQFTDRRPFNFVTGPLAPCVAAHWADPDTMAESLLYHLELHARTEHRRWFMASVANHDTLPCPFSLSRPLLTLLALLPQSVPFLYSGTEFGCEVVTNLEFGTLPPERSQPTEFGLLLFSPVPIDVDEGRLAEFQGFWAELLKLRKALADLLGADAGPTNLKREGMVVCGKIGEVEFAFNCAGAGFEWAPPFVPSRKGLWLSSHLVEVSDAGICLPARSLVLRVPTHDEVGRLASSLAHFHMMG